MRVGLRPILTERSSIQGEKYSLSVKGGCSDGASFIESYSSIKGTGYEVILDKDAGGTSLRDRKRAIQGTGKATKSKVVFVDTTFVWFIAWIGEPQLEGGGQRRE